jgi:cell wall-associated NlpC family hydrolase
MTDQERAQRAAVVAEARSWIRTPYHPRARLKGVGVDCAMLPAEVYARCGLIPAVEVAHYSPQLHLHRNATRFLEEIEKRARVVPSPLPGDMAVYRFGHAFAHGAIVLDWPTIVHAVLNLSVVEDDGESPVLAIDPRHNTRRERLFYRLNQWGDDA